jgi:hypothetical protein
MAISFFRVQFYNNKMLQTLRDLISIDLILTFIANNDFILSKI